MEWDGMGGWDGMRWSGMEWDGMEWDEVDTSGGCMAVRTMCRARASAAGLCGGQLRLLPPCALVLVVPEKSKYQTHLLEEELIWCEACSG